MVSVAVQELRAVHEILVDGGFRRPQDGFQEPIALFLDRMRSRRIC